MTEKARKVVGAIIAAAGVVELVMAINEGVLSSILMGVCFCLIGGLYFLEKKGQ